MSFLFQFGKEKNDYSNFGGEMVRFFRGFGEKKEIAPYRCNLNK